MVRALVINDIYIILGKCVIVEIFQYFNWLTVYLLSKCMLCIINWKMDTTMFQISCEVSSRQRYRLPDSYLTFGADEQKCIL